jgi:hypothetical protein
MDQDYIQRYGRKRYLKRNKKPITKVNSKLDKELQEWEVDSTKCVGDLNQ